MENKEMQLEKVAERAVQNAERIRLAPPIFELYAAMLSMSLSMIMFLFPELLESRTFFYPIMTMIMPQDGWALGFFTGGVVSAFGIIFNKTLIRVFSLVVMSILYGMLTTIYGVILPNFGFVMMFWVTVFTVASIPLIKYTGITIFEKGDKRK